MTKREWAFWTISAWQGRFSKFHYIRGDGLTLCGRQPRPEYGSPLVYEDESIVALDEERCVVCKKIAEME